MKYDYYIYFCPSHLITIFCDFFSFPKQQLLDSAELKEFAEDNFKFDENSRKFSIRVENTVGKGEIANFSFSHSVFKRLVEILACLGKGNLVVDLVTP